MVSMRPTYMDAYDSYNVLQSIQNINNNNV